MAKNLEEWLYDGLASGEAETAQFCDLLNDMRIQMEGEGEIEDAIREHLLGMAGEFIATAQAFRKVFGGIEHLTRDDPEGNDYTLDADQGSVWIRVKNVAVWLLPREDGVTVHLHRDHHEDEDPIDSAVAFCAPEEVDNG